MNITIPTNDHLQKIIALSRFRNIDPRIIYNNDTRYGFRKHSMIEDAIGKFEEYSILDDEDQQRFNRTKTEFDGTAVVGGVTYHLFRED